MAQSLVEVCTAKENFASAMTNLGLFTDLTDMTVTCGDKEWKVHSTILAVRSPFFKAAIINNTEVKRHIKIDIEEFDPEVMNEVIEFMYGKITEKGSVKFLFEAAERFHMEDLREDVIRLAKKKMTVENVNEIGHLAEMYDIEHLVGECARFIVKNNVEMKEEDGSARLMVKIISIYQDIAKLVNSENKDSKDENSINTSLASLMSKLVEDYDLRDLIVTCGDRKWKVHSFILAVRSPFFMAAVTNNMKEKLEMKIDIKEFDPEAMDVVINFMYGTPVSGSPQANFLFEAAERFQMNDLREDVIKFAREGMNVDNVVELGHIAEMYDFESFLNECAEFIVKNDVQMKEDELSPKLVVMVLGIFKDAKRKLEDDIEKLTITASELKASQMTFEEKWQNCANKLKEAYTCHLCGAKCTNKDDLTNHLSGKRHAKKC